MDIYFLMTENPENAKSAYSGLINEKPEECCLVHCSGNPLPYLTKSKDGLAVTRTKYSLFKYTPGSNVAIYVDDIRRTGNIRCDIILTPQQIELIETAIKEDYFFD